MLPNDKKIQTVFSQTVMFTRGVVLLLLVLLPEAAPAAAPAGSDTCDPIAPVAGTTLLHAGVAFARQWAINSANERLSWDGIVGRATLSLVETLLRPIAMAVAAIGAMETSLPPGEHVCNASMAGLKAFANVTSIAIRNLGSIAPFELTPVGSSRLAAAASFGRLETAIGVQASMQGPFGFNQRASFVCHANLSDVRATITWRVATLVSQAQEALQGMAASDGLPHGIARAAAALRTGDVALQEANVSVNGAIALSFTGADGSGPPPLLWKILSRALSSVLKAVIEELATAALNEALVSVASGVAVAPRGEQASAEKGELEGVAADEVSPETADSATHMQRDTGHDTYFYVNSYRGRAATRLKPLR